MPYEFTQTLTCDGVHRKAGDRVPAEEIHPGSLKSLVRLGQVKEVPDSAIAVEEPTPPPDETIPPESETIPADGETPGEPDKPKRRKK